LSFKVKKSKWKEKSYVKKNLRTWRNKIDVSNKKSYNNWTCEVDKNHRIILHGCFLIVTISNFISGHETQCRNHLCWLLLRLLTQKKLFNFMLCPPPSQRVSSPSNWGWKTNRCISNIIFKSISFTNTPLFISKCYKTDH